MLGEARIPVGETLYGDGEDHIPERDMLLTMGAPHLEISYSCFIHTPYKLKVMRFQGGSLNLFLSIKID